MALWYPGHMAKARALVRENVKLVDLVLEVVDARIPESSSNPELGGIIKEKPRLVVLNKADLADPKGTKAWIQWYRARDLEALPMAAVLGKGTSQLIRLSRKLVAPVMEKLAGKGRKPRAARLLIVGIPNVGKSSLLNRLAGRKRAATGARPGITRGKQWVRVEEGLELLDTPGILWPREDWEGIGIRLAATGALPMEEVPVEEVAVWLGEVLLGKGPDKLAARYGFNPLPHDVEALLDAIARKRGLLLPGGRVDRDRTARLLLKEFQEGQLGSITLENPPGGEGVNQ